MKDKQEQIFYIAGQSEQEVTESPFVERLLKKGYEVLYLTEAVDEYAISALPEFESKKFQNVAKEGVDIDGDSGAAKQRKEDLKERFVLIFFIGLVKKGRSYMVFCYQNFLIYCEEKIVLVIEKNF